MKMILLAMEKAIVLNQQSVANLKISNIRITRWDGRIEDTQANKIKLLPISLNSLIKMLLRERWSQITNNLLTIQTIMLNWLSH
jgi:hypothetical protein